MTANYNQITETIIGAAIEVHKSLGPGLLESAYRELFLRGLRFEREVGVPLEYKTVELAYGYRLDFLVENCVVVEIKAVEAIAPIHEAQLVTYLKLGGWKVGLLVNFNVLLLKDGIRRRVFNFED